MSNPMTQELMNSMFSAFAEYLTSPIRNIIKEEISELNKSTAEETFLSRDQIAEMLDIDTSTVHNWTKTGKLIAHQIEGTRRVYYKKTEIMANMQELKQYK